MNDGRRVASSPVAVDWILPGPVGTRRTPTAEMLANTRKITLGSTTSRRNPVAIGPAIKVVVIANSSRASAVVNWRGGTISAINARRDGIVAPEVTARTVLITNNGTNSCGNQKSDAAMAIASKRRAEIPMRMTRPRPYLSARTPPMGPANIWGARNVTNTNETSNGDPDSSTTTQPRVVRVAPTLKPPIIVTNHSRRKTGLRRRSTAAIERMVRV